MIDRGRHNLLGVEVCAVDYESAVATIVEAAKAGKGLGVSALAVHGVMTGVLDPEHRYRLNHLGLVVPDGQPVRWGLNLLHGTALEDRVYGPTLTLKTCEAAAKEGLPIYLYGSKPEVLEKFSANLIARFPGLQVAGSSSSRFRTLSSAEKAEVISEVRGSGARILMVGLGCPRQEVFAFEFAEALGMPALAVGAAFDFHAGLLPQAPSWLQKRGLEWLYRLIQEPRRLFKRYAVLNPMYLWMLAMQKLGKRYDSAGKKPEREILYG